MTIVEMLEQSGVLTLLGMGIVFAFLIVMIICVSLVGRIIRAFDQGKDVGAPAKAGVSPAGPAGRADNGAVTAAISAAVNEYRKTNS
ncbi:MAG: OadG family protein [Treponema sp.]|jgi:oxaloacetate decarboxylase gamma subunit|nr:OadG family protein [Treponema sp.]